MQFHTCNLYATLPWVSSDTWGFFICVAKRSLHRCRLLFYEGWAADVEGNNAAHRGRPLNLLYETRSERSFKEYHRKHSLTSEKLAEHEKIFFEFSENA